MVTSIARNWLCLFVINAVIAGISLDYFIGTKIDYWIHDPALIYQARTEWKYSGIVVLDDAVPMQVSRKQALPLFARAAEQLISAGAKGLYLDARLPKENEGIMPYAVCIEENGDVQWSHPGCVIAENQCQLSNSNAGNAPLKMASNVFESFRIAPYLDQNQANLPDFLLYDWENEAFIPKTGLVALDRLITNHTPIARWMDLTAEHASLVMSNFIDTKRVAALLKAEPSERCDQNLPCQRVRFSPPFYTTQENAKQPIIPVSKLASCNASIAQKEALLLKNRVVVLQLTTPAEAADIVITPMTTAFFGPHKMTPGPQYLVDSIETLLNDDSPRAPHVLIRIFLFLIVAVLGVGVSAYSRQVVWVWLTGVLVLLLMVGLCFYSPIVQLWPVTVALLTFLTGTLQTISMQLFIGFKQGKLIIQYMPKQVHKMMLSLKSNELFQNQRYQAIVLMSDLAGYTTVTGMLKEPMHILNLMNDYLDQTSFVLQDRYEGWLETYIGDMVCYYWPYKEPNEKQAFQNALLGAIELANLQKRFFAELSERYRNTFDTTVLTNLQQIMNAGIGLSSGTVVMGDLGPKRGVRKFGILGDPMNLTSRVEGLTRYFNTEIIITIDFLPVAKELGFPVRRLGEYCVKGRELPAILYAIGNPEDPRFETTLVNQWESWLNAQEEGSTEWLECPERFTLDQKSLLNWKARGLLKQGIWYLDEK